MHGIKAQFYFNMQPLYLPLLRIPLLEYRGCHGIARICFAAPYGATPEVQICAAN